MHIPPERSGLTIVGAGPGGLAPLFAAANTGHLDNLLRRGITILERSGTLGSGALGRYAIRSDSSPEALLDIVLRSSHPDLASLRSHPATQAVAQSGRGSVSLQTVGKFLEVAGLSLCNIISASEKGRVVRGATAQWVQKAAPGLWRVRYTDACGNSQEVESENVVLATGASQPLKKVEKESVAGTPLLPHYSTKLMQSDHVLAQDGMARVSNFLGENRHPKIAIVGGSTSAAAVALKLLTSLPDAQFKPGSITLLHRKPLRVFYETAAEALRDGYTEFTPEDICPLTGRVFRLSGFRLDSRELVMAIRGLAGRPPEPRVQSFQLTPEREADAKTCLDEADLVIAALGYKPRLLPVFDGKMRPVALHKTSPDRWAMVDPQSRLLTAEAQPLDGLFAIGLAVGPAANPALGGEFGFRGQVNSLWLWQHTVGKTIVSQILERTRSIRATKADESRRSTPAIPGLLASQSARPQVGGAS